MNNRSTALHKKHKGHKVGTSVNHILIEIIDKNKNIKCTKTIQLHLVETTGLYFPTV